LRGRPARICSSSLRARSIAVAGVVPTDVACCSGGGVDGLQLGMSLSIGEGPGRYLLSSGRFPQPARVVPVPVGTPIGIVA
jgi:hypothetical protein